MKNLKLYESFINENRNNVWDKLGPNWLFDYVISIQGSGPGDMDYITTEHKDLDITVIFFVHSGDIRWTWTWGSEDKDIQSMIAREIKEEETLNYNISGDSPKEFVNNVIAKISVVEKARQE